MLGIHSSRTGTIRLSLLSDCEQQRPRIDCVDPEGGVAGGAVSTVGCAPSVDETKIARIGSWGPQVQLML